MSAGQGTNAAAVLPWNAGGWFGSQLGATVWMLVAGVLAAVHDLATGLVAVLLFVGANLVGLVLWRTRRLSCYASIQALIAVSGACGLLCVHVLERASLWTRIQVGGQVPATGGYWTIGLTCGCLLLFFHLRFGRARWRA